MRRSGVIIFGSLMLAVFVAGAVALAFINPLSTGQRVAVLSVVTLALLWLIALLGGLRRTREGLDRLGGLPPLVLDLLPPIVMVTVSVLIDRMGTGRTDAVWFAGLAAGAVLSFPFSLTQRWLWWEWKWRRRRRSSEKAIRLATSRSDVADSRHPRPSEPGDPVAG